MSASSRKHGQEPIGDLARVDGEGDAHGPRASGSRPHPLVWTLVAITHAAVLALAGRFVPWDPWAPFAVACHVLAVLHLAGALTGWSRSDAGRRLHRTALGTLALGSLAHLGVMSIVVARSATILVAIYGDLGKGLAAALAAAFCVEVLFTLPVGCWAVALSRGAGPIPTRRRVIAGLAIGLSLLGTAATLEPMVRLRPVVVAAPVVSARWSRQPRTGGTPEAGVVAAVAATRPALGRTNLALEAVVDADASCPRPMGTPGQSTAFVAFATSSRRDGPHGERDAKSDTARDEGSEARTKVRHLCVQAPPGSLFDALETALDEASATRPLRVDIVTSARTLPNLDVLARPFALRPGLDGLCVGDVCTTPWQLAARRAFVSLTPVPTIPDLRMGVDLATFSAGREGALVSFSTRSYLVPRDGRVLRTSRLAVATDEARARGEGPWRAAPSDVQASIERATQHIARAQRKDGRFRYTIDPFRARRSDNGINLPRQAGTTLVLCELAGEEHLEVMRGALQYMSEQAIASGEVVALRKGGRRPDAHDPNDATDLTDLGSTALPAIAFLACRPRTGSEHDATIVGVVRFLLAMQLPDGTFHPAWDLHAGAPQPGPHPLFAEGQAVYALGLAERLAHEAPELGLDEAVLHAAVERSLEHFSRDYWPRVLRDFFFVEENWHCLAARALLEIHRHDGYERFCLDYVAFKRRLLLHAEDRVHADFVGGYGFGNVVPPQSTPTAGLGEALAAAIDLARARGEDSTAMARDLELVQAFLLRQQWTPQRCFGCRDVEEIDGGFSESMVSPGLRIDYTQHAMAALGHGARVLARSGGRGTTR